jgi:hypothetical protein
MCKLKEGRTVWSLGISIGISLEVISIGLLALISERREFMSVANMTLFW